MQLATIAWQNAPRYNSYPLLNVRIVDADTVIADIVVGFGVRLVDARIRASDYDAWEVSKTRPGVSDDELKRGAEAKRQLVEIVRDSKMFLLSDPLTPRHDVYGRVLGVLWVEKDGKTAALREYAEALGWIRGSASP